MRKISMSFIMFLFVLVVVVTVRPTEAKAYGNEPVIDSVTISSKVTDSNPGTLTFHVTTGVHALSSLSVVYVLDGAYEASYINNFNRWGQTYYFEKIFGHALTTGTYSVPIERMDSQSGQYHLWYFMVMGDNMISFDQHYSYHWVDDTVGLNLYNPFDNSETCTVSNAITFTTDDERPVYAADVQYKRDVEYANIMTDIANMPEGSTLLIDYQNPGYFIDRVPGSYFQAIKGHDKTLKFYGYDSSWEINGLDINKTIPSYVYVKFAFNFVDAGDSHLEDNVSYYDYAGNGAYPIKYIIPGKIKVTAQVQAEYPTETLYYYSYYDASSGIKSLGVLNSFTNDGVRSVIVTVDNPGIDTYIITSASSIKLHTVPDATTTTTPSTTTTTMTPSTETSTTSTTDPNSITYTGPTIPIYTPSTTSTESTVTVGTTFSVGDMQYKVTGTNTVTLTLSNVNTGSVIIPSEVTYNGTTYSITVIGEKSFLGKKITSVVIPDSVLLIEKSAFDQCSKLKTVVLGKNVATIKKYAFYTKKLTKLTFTGSKVPLVSRGAIYSKYKVTVIKGSLKKSDVKKTIIKAGITKYTIK